MSTADRAAERRRKILAKQKDRMAVATGAAENISRESDGADQISGINNGLATEPGVVAMETPRVAAQTGPFAFPLEGYGSMRTGQADEVLARPSGSASRQESTPMPLRRRGTGFPGQIGDFRGPGFPSQIGPSAFGQVQDPSSAPETSARTLEINQQRARLPRAPTYLRLVVLLITSVGLIFSAELFEGAKTMSAVQAFAAVEFVIYTPNVVSLWLLVQAQGKIAFLFALKKEVSALYRDGVVYFFCFFLLLRLKSYYATYLLG
ncbi:hypothetical protein NDN08_008192 [Rhodosorus marinus]|uniref:Protein RFT1 homolog n=1 Tax=Rhodosorus marinus TaxID=101924 RepID=A0AAV8V3X8_9RHOD|nr:hypothetical protein NDN08_008192 [Rhodosorus marinus]